MKRSKVGAWGYRLALLVVAAAVAQAPEPAAPAPRLKLAYVYKGDKGGADGFKTLLDGAGLPTDLVKADAVEETDFGPYGLIPQPVPIELTNGLAQAMFDQNPRVRIEAVYGLGVMARQRLRPLLVPAWRSAPGAFRGSAGAPGRPRPR